MISTDYNASATSTYSTTTTPSTTVEATESTLVDTSLEKSEVVDATTTETSTDTSGEHDEASSQLDEFVISGNTFTGTSSSGVYSMFISGNSSSSSSSTTEDTDAETSTEVDYDQLVLDSYASQQTMLSAMMGSSDSSSTSSTTAFGVLAGYQPNGVDFSAIYKANSSFNTLNASKDLMVDYFAD